MHLCKWDVKGTAVILGQILPAGGKRRINLSKLCYPTCYRGVEAQECKEKSSIPDATNNLHSVKPLKIKSLRCHEP